ncbi:alpha,alpha-phosphotrehalase, partial [Lactobacillus sp. XV13L]|nr:alpha,alpha-phosphotrehalase [Lactobacillus sp. XV13L]
ALEIIQAKSRDNSRTPMSWDDSKNAGFTTGKPWLQPTQQDHINVADELKNGEIFKYYQHLIKLRKNFPIIAQGSYQPLDLTHPQVFAYVRSLRAQSLIVINNFYGQSTKFQLPVEFQQLSTTALISNYQRQLAHIPHQITLQPYEAIALLITKK